MKMQYVLIIQQGMNNVYLYMGDNISIVNFACVHVFNVSKDKN